MKAEGSKKRPPIKIERQALLALEEELRNAEAIMRKDVSASKRTWREARREADAGHKSRLEAIEAGYVWHCGLIKSRYPADVVAVASIRRGAK